MSEKVALTVSCDVCGRPFWASEDNDRRDRPKPVKTAVWFETEQNEGMPVEPYLDAVEIDLCPECAERAIHIRAHGCMGRNEYRIEACAELADSTLRATMGCDGRIRKAVG